MIDHQSVEPKIPRVHISMACGGKREWVKQSKQFQTSLVCENSRASSLPSVWQIQSDKHLCTLIISWSEVTSVWSEVNLIMEGTGFTYSSTVIQLPSLLQICDRISCIIEWIFFMEPRQVGSIDIICLQIKLLCDNLTIFIVTM